MPLNQHHFANPFSLAKSRPVDVKMEDEWGETTHWSPLESPVFTFKSLESLGVKFGDSEEKITVSRFVSRTVLYFRMDGQDR